MAEFYAFIKAFPAAVKLIQSFVDAWVSVQITRSNEYYQEREEEREAIIWAMEQARLAHDLTKIRALNRHLAALDGAGSLPDRPVQPTQN